MEPGKSMNKRGLTLHTLRKWFITKESSSRKNKEGRFNLREEGRVLVVDESILLE